MKFWAGLLTLFLLAAVGAVRCPRACNRARGSTGMRPSGPACPARAAGRTGYDVSSVWNGAISAPWRFWLHFQPRSTRGVTEQKLLASHTLTSYAGPRLVTRKIGVEHGRGVAVRSGAERGASNFDSTSLSRVRLGKLTNPVTDEDVLAPIEPLFLELLSKLKSPRETGASTMNRSIFRRVFGVIGRLVPGSVKRAHIGYAGVEVGAEFYPNKKTSRHATPAKREADQNGHPLKRIDLSGERLDDDGWEFHFDAHLKVVNSHDVQGKIFWKVVGQPASVRAISSDHFAELVGGWLDATTLNLNGHRFVPATHSEDLGHYKITLDNLNEKEPKFSGTYRAKDGKGRGSSGKLVGGAKLTR